METPLNRVVSRADAVRWQTDVLLAVRWIQSHRGQIPRRGATSLFEQRCARILDAVKAAPAAAAEACRNLDEFWLLAESLGIDPAEVCHACR